MSGLPPSRAGSDEATESGATFQGFGLDVNGDRIHVIDARATLLEVLREQVGLRSVKDGCSPQGQCGCCTVLVDGQPRLACVTPARRLGRSKIVTLEGLDADVRAAWASVFTATGASQCGFCTPGIICRFVGLDAKGADHDDRSVAARGLAAHLCRCTGWQPILDAWVAYPRVKADGQPSSGVVDRKRRAGGAETVSELRTPRAESELRASIEGRSAQTVGAHVALGEGGFADDRAPADALVAVRAGPGCEYADDDGWVVAETIAEARRRAGRVLGRRTSARWDPPLPAPPGDWAFTLRTSWVEPGYLETDASWCEPGKSPASPLCNGGAFGAKRDSPLAEAARRLADRHGKAVRVLWSRPDTVELGWKRPPLAAGIQADGAGAVIVARTPGIAAAIHAYAPGLSVTEVGLAGPPTSAQARAAGWAEAAALTAATAGGAGPVRVTAPDGGSATAGLEADGSISVTVDAGRPLDVTVLRSYCTGAAHMAYSWVTSETLGVDPNGVVHDLTIRSFGIVAASRMPPVSVEVVEGATEPVNGSDAVFAAVAAATWRHRGFPPCWPTDR